MITEKNYQKRKRFLTKIKARLEEENLDITEDLSDRLKDWLYGEIESKDINNEMITRFIDANYKEENLKKPGFFTLN